MPETKNPSGILQKPDLDEILKPNIVPFQGGCNTVLESEQIPMGKHSMVQNFRNMHPGFKQRLGQRKLHTSSDGTNGVQSLFHFVKGKKTERHFYAQMSDDDVLEATNQPPTVTTGVFGSEAFSGSANSRPASWGVIDDTLLFSNHVDQHQIYHGEAYVEKLTVYKGAVVPPIVPTEGYDYSKEVSDGLTTTKAILDNLAGYGVTLVTNGTFPSGIASWDDESTGDGSFAFDTDHAELDANTGTAAMGQTITVVNSKVHILTFDITENCTGLTVTGGTAAYAGTEHFNESYTSVGSKSITFTSAGTSLYLLLKSSTNEIVSIDNVVLTSYECIFIKTPVSCKQFTVTVSKVNGTASVAALKYWNGAFTAVTNFSDGTSAASKSLAQSGDMTWTQPTDAIPHYMYGQNGFWWQLYLSSGSFDSEVEITAVTFEADWQGIVNKWDGYLADAIESQFYDQSAAVYNTYGSAAISIGEMTTSDRVYFATFDPIVGVYNDVGATPNTTAATTINAFKFWDGESWTSVTNLQDDTAGLSQSGYVTFKRQPTIQKRQFQKTQHYLYWYYFTVDKTLSANISIGLLTMPYFDITFLGNKGVCNCAWKKRVVYNFEKNPSWIYITASSDPQVLNGTEYAPLQMGDGRANKVVAIRKFYNELISYQEEKGKEGGCITLVQGYDEPTYGTYLVSGTTGAFNANCVDVVEGLQVSEDTTGSMAFSLGNKGVSATDGKSISNISGDIGNYFDPTKDECIRRGYEHLHWLKYDPAYKVIRIGLVSGISVQIATATSTTANKLVDTAGAFATRKTVSGHPISHTIAIGDTVYNTTDDTSALITAIDSATILSLDADIMVSGEGYEIYSATCNLFPVYDPSDGSWSFDRFQQNLGILTEVEAASGNVASIMVAGGVNDGTVYQSNYGENDVATAIDAYADVELNAAGKEMELDEVLLTLKKGGHLTITPYVDGDVQTATTETSVPAVRNKYDMNYRGMDIKIRIQNLTAGESFYLFGIGFRLYSNETR